MELRQLLASYELDHEISASYAYQLGYAVSRFERYLSRVPEIADLTPDAINRWLLHEQRAAVIADRTRRNVRASMLTLWEYSEAELNRSKVRKVRVTPKPPEAWWYEEMAKVAKAAESLPGRLVNGLPRSRYFSTCFWFTYETGLRRGDVWSFDVDRFDKAGVASLAQHKSRRLHVVTVTSETLGEIRQMSEYLKSRDDPHFRTALRFPGHFSSFYYWVVKARKLAGVDAEKLNRALQHIRRTGATLCERSEPGTAYRYLGHAGTRLAEVSYIDPRKAWQTVMPPVNRHHGRAQPGPGS